MVAPPGLRVGKSDETWTHEDIIIDAPDGLGDDGYKDHARFWAEYNVWQKYNADATTQLPLPLADRKILFVHLLSHEVIPK